MKLRDYQLDQINAAHAAWQNGVLRTAVVAPTGSGKTVVMAALALESMKRHDPKSTLVIVDRDELVNQTVAKIRMLDDDADIGIVKAAKNELDATIIVASIQTLARPNRLAPLVGNVDRVIADEIHMSAAASWRTVISAFDVPTVGFTATFFRNDGKKLTDLWETIAWERDALWGIDTGMLCDVRGIRVTVDGLDLDKVALRAGDWAAEELSDAMVESGAGAVIARAYTEHAAGRPAILFAPSVASAVDFAAHLRLAGVTAAVVTGATPLDERRTIYRDYELGTVSVLCSVGVLTTGFDAPHTSCIIMARPTKSQLLYIQAVGRGMRPSPGKDDCLVLDCTGVSRDHTLLSVADLSRSRALTLAEGETLGQARQRHDDGLDPVVRATMPDVHQAKEFDPFTQSRIQWKRTHAGTWFVTTEKWIIFIWPGDDPWLVNVGRKPSATNKYATGGWIAQDVPAAYAMALAEEQAEVLGAEDSANLSGKAASWRRGKVPSEGQLKTLARLRIVAPAGMTKSQASDLIDVEIVSRALDKHRS